jgi:hypothetical protein
MVAGKWGWGFAHMAPIRLAATVGIVVSNLLVYLVLRRDFRGLAMPGVRRLKRNKRQPRRIRYPPG